MNKKTVVIIIAFSLILSLFTGCQDNLIETLEKVKAEIEISVKLPAALTPDGFDHENFSYTLTWYPADDKNNETTEDFMYEEDNLHKVYKVNPGEYTFVIEGKDANDNVKVRGERTISIQAGQLKKLEIPLEYYIFGDKGFIIEPGIIRLTDNLDFTDSQKITIPSDMKLVIEDGCIITVPDGKTLTFDGVVETLGSLKVEGNLTVTEDFSIAGDITFSEDTILTLGEGKDLTVGGSVHAEKNFTVTGDGKLTIEDDLTVGNAFVSGKDSTVVVETLAVAGTTEVKGQVSAHHLAGKEGVDALSITVDDGGSLTIATIASEYEKVTVTGGGSLKIHDDVTLGKVDLKEGSKLEIEGTLYGVGAVGTTQIEVSGNGALLAGSVVSDTLSADEDLTVTADTFYVKELASEVGVTLTLDGDVTTGKVTGNVLVDGTVSAEDLSIVNRATLEASALIGDKVTTNDGGSLQVNGDASVDEFVLEGNATVAIDGNLHSNTVSGEGSLTADIITTGKLSNTGDLTITAGTISADEIELEDDKTLTLTLEGDVTAGLISGDGKLAITGEVGGVAGNLTITGSPTVEGDLHLEAGTTVDITAGATLEVTGNVETDGALTITGNGILDVDGDLSVGGKLTADDNQLDVDGDITQNTLRYGVKPYLIVHIEADEILELDEIDVGWETVTVSGGGTFKVGTITASLEKITLENDSVIEVSETLKSDEISGVGSLKAKNIEATTVTVADGRTLTLTGTGNHPPDGVVTIGSATGSGTVVVEGTITADLSIASDATLEVSGLATDTIKITSGGTLKISEDTTLKKVELEDGSTLEVDGNLSGSGETGIEILGDGSITADSIDADKLTSKGGDQNITADSITVDEVYIGAGGTVTVDGDVTTAVVTGTGSLTVDGTVKSASLTIENGATLEAEKFEAENVTVEGSLKINDDTTVENLNFGAGSTLEIVGTLQSTSITGEGTLVADSVTTEELSNTGDLTITAGTISAVEIELEDDKTLTLTLEGDVTTGLISGDGKLAITGEVGGVAGNLTITGNPTVDGDLHLEAGTTVEITAGATLEVTGNVEAEGELTLTGEGNLEIDGVLTAKGELSQGDVNVTATGGISENTLLYGTKPNLIVSVGPGKELTLSELDAGWETITVTGGGTFKVDAIATEAKIDLITFEDGSTMEVVGTLKLTDDATLNLDGDATLTITGKIEAAGNLTVQGDGALEVTGKLAVVKHLTIDEAAVSVDSLSMEAGMILEITNNGSLNVSEDTEIDEVVLSDGSTLEVDGAFKSDEISGVGSVTATSIEATTAVTTDDGTLTLTVTDFVTVDSITGSGTVVVDGAITADDLSIASGATVEVSELAADTIKITGGGTLKISEDTTLKKVELKDGSTLNVDGKLHGADATGIEVSGNGALNAKSIGADKLTSKDGDQNITVDSSITLNEINVGAGVTVTIDGVVTTKKVTGTGSLKVDGTIEGDTLVVASGATLEVDELDVKELTVEGSLKVNNDTTVETLELGSGSTLEIDGTLQSNTISGEGSLTADSVTTEQLSNTGDLTITADPINAKEINLAVGKTLTLDGSVITGSISGSGTLDTQSIGGMEKEGRNVINITDDPIIAVDLMIDSDTTIDISAAGATLTVDGDIKAWGDLILEGDGVLHVTGDLTVEKSLIHTNGQYPSVTGTIRVDTPPLGEKPNLVLHINSGKIFTMESIGNDWETVTVVGGGTLKVGTISAALDKITLENDSKLEVDGTLVSDTISGRGTVEAANITVDTVDVVDNGTLTLIGTGDPPAGVVTIDSITGSGTVVVDGAVTSDDLSIASSATLEAASLVAKNDTITVTDGGTLKISEDMTLKKLELEDGSRLEIVGDLSLKEDSSVTFADNATLLVNGDVEAEGDFAISGTGTLDVAGDLTVIGKLTANADQLDIGGDIDAGSLSPGAGQDLGVKVERGKTLTVPTLVGHETISVTGGGRLLVSEVGATTLEEIVFEDDSTMEVAGTLKGKDGTGIAVSGDGALVASTIETNKLSSSGNQTITASSIEATEIVMSGEKTLTLSGDVETNKISGAGKIVVKGTVTTTNLEIGVGTTLDVSANNALLNTSGQATVKGTLDLGSGGWNSVDLVGTLVLSGDSADLRINGQPKWYTLYGSQAQYFKEDNAVQLRFLEGSGVKKVTPAKVSAIPTESVTRVGSGVNFEVTTMNKLNLAAKELILEDGSSTLIAQNWWTLGNSLVLGSGAITVNAGATVKYGDTNAIWIGNSVGEFVLTGSAQMKYSATEGTEILSTGAPNDAQLEFKDWKVDGGTRELNHTFTVGENAKILVNKDTLTVGSDGKIVIEEHGKLEIKNNKLLETTETNQLNIRGEVIVNNGATISIADAMFTFDKNKQTGSVLLKSGSIWMAAGTVYYAPSTTIAGRRDISFNTDGVDLELTPFSENLGVRNYKITGAGGTEGTLSINYSRSGINSGSQIITVGNNAILELNKSFDIAPTEASYSSITVEAGGMLKVLPGSILTTGDTNRTVKIESGGKLENYGTINIKGSGKLDIAGEATVKEGGTIKTENISSIKFSENNGDIATLIVEPGAKLALPSSSWMGSSSGLSNGKVVIKGGGVITYKASENVDERKWFGGAGSASFLNLGSDVQATFEGAKLTFSKIPNQGSNTTVNVRNISADGGSWVMTPHNELIIDSNVRFEVDANQSFGSRGNLTVKNSAALVVNGFYGIIDNKTVTVQAGGTLEISNNGRIRKVTSGSLSGGSINILTGGIVKVEGVNKPVNAAATYSGKVTDHIVKYNGTQVFKHP